MEEIKIPSKWNKELNGYILTCPKFQTVNPIQISSFGTYLGYCMPSEKSCPSKECLCYDIGNFKKLVGETE